MCARVCVCARDVSTSAGPLFFEKHHRTERSPKGCKVPLPPAPPPGRGQEQGQLLVLLYLVEGGGGENVEWLHQLGRVWESHPEACKEESIYKDGSSTWRLFALLTNPVALGFL